MIVALVVLGFAVFVGLLGLLIFVPVLQQRRLLRTRDRLTGRLIVAQDKERAAIAREIHDDLLQRLIALSRSLRQPAGVDPVEQSHRLDLLIQQLRTISHGLHPTTVTRLGLAAALSDLAHLHDEQGSLHVTWHNALGDETLADGARLALYRVAQEALGNAAKYSGADTVAMELRRDADRVVLSIADRGRGFDLGTAEQSEGIGLVSMRERLAFYRGILQIDSAPGQGTTIAASLPLPQVPA